MDAFDLCIRIVTVEILSTAPTGVILGSSGQPALCLGTNMHY